MKKAASRTWRRVCLTGLTGAALAVLGGCDTQGAELSPDAGPTAASVTTSSAPSADVGAPSADVGSPSDDVGATSDDVGPGDTEELSVAGFLEMLRAPGDDVLGSQVVVLDVTSGRGMPMGAGRQRATVRADFRGEDPELDATLEMDDGTGVAEMRMVVLDGVVYSTVPLQEAGLPAPAGGVEYVEFALADLGLYQPGMFGPDSPLTFVETLWGEWDRNGEAVSFVESEERNGVELDRYLVTLEESSLGGTDGETSSFSSLWPEALFYHVWLDAAGRMRRVEASGDEATMVATIDAWGRSLNLVPPDPSTVMAMEEWEQTTLGDE
ncbi:hypothetical protein ACI3ET_05715 [Ornithinimicrobium sp. LYQ121]|uniref:hypothetical protein n=1 Tax=Ornithinimicrobium sp. LYQ121 TaxID=3378801 RepID=UPI00385241FB